MQSASRDACRLMERGKERRKVATVGTFDGLHRGHRRVLEKVREVALGRGLEPMVVCFDRHPLETVAPERAPKLIQNPSDRTNRLYREGMQLLTLEFTAELARLTAREWLARMHEEQGVDVLVVGYDNTFGSDGVRMSLADYHAMGRELGVEVVEAPYEPHASSSAIRRLVREGDIEEANRLLGRRFEISGTVTPGKRLGRSIGYPTANVEPDYRALMPKRGVYAVEVELPGEPRLRKGVANVGTQPTAGERLPERLEVHIPGYEGDLYGERLRVYFERRIRDERRFDSMEELRERIARDIAETTDTDI